MVSSLAKELKMQKDYLLKNELDSIYFGGGTPSLLTQEHLEIIFNGINKTFNYNSTTEITIEANPDDINIPKLKLWKKLGINRISLGVQSFNDEELLFLKRTHNSQKSIQAIEEIKSVGFDNFTIDLIFGLPQIVNDGIKLSLNKSLAFEVPHISCYALTVEKKTLLHHLISKEKMKPLDDKKLVDEFLYIEKVLEEKKYNHYEISNYSKIGFESKHNKSYWEQKEYLGIGPSSHSYNYNSRKWNCSNNQEYISNLEKGILPSTQEILSIKEKINELVLLGLRTKTGINWDKHIHHFPQTYIDEMKIKFSKSEHLINGKMKKVDNSYSLTSRGKLFCDTIVLDLML